MCFSWHVCVLLIWVYFLVLFVPRYFPPLTPELLEPVLLQRLHWIVAMSYFENNNNNDSLWGGFSFLGKPRKKKLTRLIIIVPTYSPLEPQSRVGDELHLKLVWFVPKKDCGSKRAQVLTTDYWIWLWVNLCEDQQQQQRNNWHLQVSINVVGLFKCFTRSSQMKHRTGVSRIWQGWISTILISRTSQLWRKNDVDIYFFMKHEKNTFFPNIIYFVRSHPLAIKMKARTVAGRG